MDDRRFDMLTRALASGRNRRQVLRALMGVGVAGVAALAQDAEAARRGYGGPIPKPTPTPCQPFCEFGFCNQPDGCGGMCICTTAGDSCIYHSCAPACGGSECEHCITDGAHQGCFKQTSLKCSDTTDCQAQFGYGICWPINGEKLCLVPGHGI